MESEKILFLLWIPICKCYFDGWCLVCKCYFFLVFWGHCITSNGGILVRQGFSWRIFYGYMRLEWRISSIGSTHGRFLFEFVVDNEYRDKIFFSNGPRANSHVQWERGNEVMRSWGLFKRDGPFFFGNLRKVKEITKQNNQILNELKSP